ncbi:hypothetical protein FRB94_014531 [Tulasnella sp. JGI-2019a]|nr:hypothetical protein FRB94_014531 [Tulasnella sp. JGI-2019a]KAG9022276.1 hypothetical protein FRB95_000436 [Tulasnella sp. JGI-2019a]
MGADTLQTAKASLQVLSAIVKAVPIPEPFKSAVVGIPDAVLQIITIIETAKGNMEDAKVLTLYIATITGRTIRSLDLSHATPATQRRIHEFQDALRQITGEITVLASWRPLRKWIINYDRDAATLSALKQKVTDVITGIQLETVVSTGHEVELLYQEQQILIRKQQEIEINQLIALLGNGSSGSSKKPPCMEGTRVSLLRWITQWIGEPLGDSRRGLCIIGAAGKGKSSVGASVAEQERRSKRLGADFYFTVDQQDRNEGVIPVLARQLASWGDGRLRNEIASALHADRDLIERRLEVQFRELIQEPLETLTDGPDCLTLVILLDGLDECNPDYACRLLDLIGQCFAKLPTAVKFIITSRPEPHLLDIYRSDPMDTELEVRSLDLEEGREVEDDIEKFFKQKLPRMVWRWVKLPSNWPGDERRGILVRLSGGLWIWAVTVARMLADENFRDPEKQLDALLSSTPDPDGKYGHNTDLYAIYSMILNRACPLNCHPDLLTLFHDVLGALCLQTAPINTHTLASLLCLNPSNSDQFTGGMRTKVLGYLQAVLIVPDVEDNDPSRDAKPIRFIHKSFQDYLTDKSQCDVRFLVNIAEEHRRMAIRCLRLMEDLQKPNICGIDPAMLNSEIGNNHYHNKDGGGGSENGDINHTTDDEGRNGTSEENRGEKDANIDRAGIDDDILKRGKNSASSKHDERLDIKGLARRHISSALQYACENWANHVSGTPPESDDVYVSVDTFARMRLLYWLEVLSLLGVTQKVAESVESVEVWLKARPQLVAPNPPELPKPKTRGRIATCITDGLLKTQAGVYLRTNMIHITSGPLSLRALDHAKRFLVDILPTQQHDVSFQASTLPRESDISTLSLLQDLKNFIVEFEVPIRTSAPHIYHSALPFTPPHTSLSQVYGHLAEGGPKARRGCLQQWSGQSALTRLAWSPNGERIISGCEDGALCLWEHSTGARVGEAWKFHTQAVACAWSPDSKMIVSGSYDSTLQLWDSTTGARIGEAWKGHAGKVLSVAWSPDSKWVVSGSADRTLRMWDPLTGASAGEAWKENDWVWCIAWSPDGKRIASGSYGSVAIHLWDPSTGAIVGEFREAGFMCPYGLAWSPDGKWIISANVGTTLTLWDASTGEPIGDRWEGHTGNTTWCVAWSPDGKRIVSGSQDKTLRLWDASTGVPIGNAWQGHTNNVRTVGWSPDGKTIVSGSQDGTPMLWNSQTGDPIRLGQRGPNSHTSHVYRLAFAPNSNRIVTASSDGTLRLWDTTSGKLVGHPVRQTTAVTSLDFSLDGRYVISEDEECRMIWNIAGEETGLAENTPVGPVFDDHPCVLKIDEDGWVRDPGERRMFWLSVVLRPIGNWGRVLVNRNILAIEVPSVPIIDISAYASRF